MRTDVEALRGETPCTSSWNSRYISTMNLETISSARQWHEHWSAEFPGMSSWDKQQALQKARDEALDKEWKERNRLKWCELLTVVRAYTTQGLATYRG